MTADQDKRQTMYLPRSWGDARKGRNVRQPATSRDEGDLTREPDGVEIPQVEEENRFTQSVMEDSEADAEELLQSPPTRFNAVSITVPDHEQTESEIPSDIPHVEPCRSCRAHVEVEERGEEPSTDVDTISVRVAGVRFGYACKIYHFDAGDMELGAGDCVIVKTEKGTGLGQVAMPPFEKVMDNAQLEGLRRIVRKAGRADFDQKTKCSQKESEAFGYCLERIEALSLPMKLVAVECFFDGSKYVFYFTAEGRVDFRELVKQLVARFPVRIEMRQIGVRHEAKMTGGIACCGQELCC